jgi:hypothetical protein
MQLTDSYCLMCWQSQYNLCSWVEGKFTKKLAASFYNGWATNWHPFRKRAVSSQQPLNNKAEDTIFKMHINLHGWRASSNHNIPIKTKKSVKKHDSLVKYLHKGTIRNVRKGFLYVRSPLGTAATSGLLYKPQMIEGVVGEIEAVVA